MLYEKNDIILMIFVILIIIIGLGYFVLDTVFSLGILSLSVDIRTELLILEYVLLIALLGLVMLIFFRKKKKN